MARGELDISHTAFETLPATRAVGYLRDLLAALDVIPPYQPALERVTPWLRELLASLPKRARHLIDRFARWQLLRRLRLFGQRDHGRRVTHSGVQSARAAILATARFPGWLESEDISLVELSRADLERYLVHRPGLGSILKPFLDWTARTAITGPLQLPNPGRPAPEVVLSDARRWQQERLGPEQHEQSVRFDTARIELPDPLGHLVRAHLSGATAAIRTHPRTGGPAETDEGAGGVWGSVMPTCRSVRPTVRRRPVLRGVPGVRRGG